MFRTLVVYNMYGVTYVARQTFDIVCSSDRSKIAATSGSVSLVHTSQRRWEVIAAAYVAYWPLDMAIATAVVVF